MVLFTNTIKYKLLPVFRQRVTVSRSFCKNYRSCDRQDSVSTVSTNRFLVSSASRTLHFGIFSETVRGCRQSTAIISMRTFSTKKTSDKGSSRLDIMDIVYRISFWFGIKNLYYFNYLFIKLGNFYKHSIFSSFWVILWINLRIFYFDFGAIFLF